MAAASDLGSLGDYMSQAGSSSDTSDGVSGLQGGDIAGGLGGMLGGEAGQGVAQTGMGLAETGIGALSLNPVAVAEGVMSLVSGIQNLIGGLSGLPRELKTSGVLYWFYAQPDKRFTLVGQYIQRQLLDAGMVLSSKPYPGHNVWAYIRILETFTDSLYGPMYHEGKLISIPVKGAEHPGGIVMPGPFSETDTKTFFRVVHNAFGVKLPPGANPAGVAALMTMMLHAGEPQLGFPFMHRLHTTRGLVVANVVGSLVDSGNSAEVASFLNRVHKVDTLDLYTASTDSAFTDKPGLDTLRICPTTDPTTVWTDGTGQLDSQIQPTENPMGSFLMPPSGAPSSSSSSSNAQTGPVSVSVNQGPDAAMEEMLMQENQTIASLASGGLGSYMPYILIGGLALLLVALMRGGSNA